MQITYYRHKKGVLRMHSRDMEYIVGLLKNGKDAEAILSVRRKLNMAFWHEPRICPENYRSWLLARRSRRMAMEYS